jgi:glucans biosynthesis protein C
VSLSAQLAVQPATIAGSRTARDRLSFIDNVRWVMILLVLSMHAAVTYSPFGGWYYREHAEAGRATLLFFATYQSFLQGFFMALLFFVAGYFVPKSYDRKGAAAFLAGRAVKLGLPTILFVVVIGPVTEYFIAHSWHTKASFAHALGVYFTRFRFLAGTGPLWFCAALLVFSICYVLYRQLVQPLRETRVASAALPGPGGVILTVAALAAATFLIRIAMPMGTAFYNMQLCYFASYVIMFGLGIAAARGDWLERLSDRFAWRSAAACLALAVLGWLPLLAFGGALQGQSDAYNGGLHWQSAAMASWEALVCVGMSFAVLAGFRACCAGQGPIARFMSDNAFAVYVIHPPLLVALAVALAGYALPPVAKFVLLWALGAVLCFGIAAPLARRLPLVGRMLQ